MSQFRVMTIRSTTWATGSAADDGVGIDMIYHLSLSNINMPFIENRQAEYWQSIKELVFRNGSEGRKAGCSGSLQLRARRTRRARVQALATRFKFISTRVVNSF
jgi:hypothetical protein